MPNENKFCAMAKKLSKYILDISYTDHKNIMSSVCTEWKSTNWTIWQRLQMLILNMKMYFIQTCFKDNMERMGKKNTF